MPQKFAPTREELSKFYEQHRDSAFDYLTTPVKEHKADLHLIPLLRTLVDAYGGKWSPTGALCVANEATKNMEMLSHDEKEPAMVFLDKKEDTRALVKLAQMVNATLSEVLTLVKDDMCRASRTTDRTTEAPDDDELAQKTRTCTLYGETRTFPRDTPHDNLNRLQPRSIPTSVFMKVLMQASEIGDAFDELNGSIRCGNHVVSVTADGISITPLPPSHNFVNDAKHDLSLFHKHWKGSFKKTYARILTITNVPTHPDYKKAAVLVGNLKAVWVMVKQWFKNLQHFRNVCKLFGARLIYRGDKWCFVLEGPADLGKTALLLLLLNAMGSYACEEPKDAISGKNHRSQPVREIHLAVAGKRFIGYDEVSEISESYLKHESNGASAIANTVGMRSQVTTKHKAMRVLTKNASMSPISSMTADMRKKVILINETVLNRPPKNEAMYQRIKAGDKGLGQAVFISILWQLEYQIKTHGLGPVPVSNALRPIASEETSVPKPTITTGIMADLSAVVRQTLMALYETSEADCTEITVVKRDVAEAAGLPIVDLITKEKFLEVFHIAQADDPDGLRYTERKKVGCVRRDVLNVVKRAEMEAPPSKKRAREDADPDSS